MVKSIAVAVLFLQLVTEIVSDSECTICLDHKIFRLKHASTGQYIVYRTDGQEGYVRMATADEMHDNESNLFCRSPDITMFEYYRYINLVAVDAGIYSNITGHGVDGTLYRADDRLFVRAHVGDAYAAFLMVRITTFTDKEHNRVEVYRIDGPHSSGRKLEFSDLVVDENNELRCIDRNGYYDYDNHYYYDPEPIGDMFHLTRA